MKRKALQIGSLLLALYVLFVAHGLNVNFHFCTEDHHVMSSFGDASELCMHCIGHHHEHHAYEAGSDVVGFNAKCCCEDFESEVGFADSFTLATEKSVMVYLPFTYLESTLHAVAEMDVLPVYRLLKLERIPYLITGRLKTIFFSSLKLNPLVF